MTLRDGGAAHSTAATFTVVGAGLTAVVDADRGGRIVSLVSGVAGAAPDTSAGDTAAGDPAADPFEWLAVGTDAPAGGFGAPFVRAGMGGWDEVAPSVSAEQAVPDHGDVWNVPWSVRRAGRAHLTLEVTLRSVPVVLRRCIAATDSGLRLSYSATTTSEQPLPFLWAAHPQFAAQPSSAIELFAGEADVRVTPGLQEEHPKRGASRAWPERAPLGDLPAGTSLKAFVEPHTAVSAARLVHPDARALRISWDAAELPYLGLFWDNAEFAGGRVIAIEPSTALGDSAAAATAAGRIRSLSASSPLEWSLELRND